LGSIWKHDKSRVLEIWEPLWPGIEQALERGETLIEVI